MKPPSPKTLKNNLFSRRPLVNYMDNALSEIFEKEYFNPKC